MKMRIGKLPGGRLAALAMLLLSAAASAAGDDLAAARAAVERRAYAQALPIFQRLLEQHPDDADLLIEAARVQGFADHNAESAKAYRRVLQVAPTRRLDVLPSLAWQTLWSFDAASAKALFVELCQIGKDRADAFDGLGQASHALGEQAAAIDAYRRSLELQAHRPGVQQRLLKALLWSDRNDEAIAVGQALVQAAPNDRDSLWMLANALNFAGRQRQALQVFARAGAPHGDGERLDVARAWRWAGYEDKAVDLLAGQTDPQAVWLRDWRVARELASYAYATTEGSIDSDHLSARVQTVGAGWRPAPGANVELSTRALALDDTHSVIDAQVLTALARWRLGEASSERGSWWPSVVLRAHLYPDWSPWTAALRMTWIPRDGWRVDGEEAREIVETPQSLSKRVWVDVVSLGADYRPDARWSTVGSIAALRFDDGNVRMRLVARADYALALKPRWVAGVELTQFNSSRPTGPDRAGRGYWNPRQYSELRGYSALSYEARPFDLYARLALGNSVETDGWGKSSSATPHAWEFGVAYDLAPRWRVRFAAGGSGAGLGWGGGGSGYWRRYANLSLNGWF